VVYPEPRAQGKGGIEFFQMEKLFGAPATCQAGFDLRINLDRQNAALVVHHAASGSKTHRKGKKERLRLGGDRN
jgi:hypothetical protein